MSVGEICNREVIIADRKTGIVELAGLMRRHHVGDVVVVERKDGNVVPVGVVTDRDLVVVIIAEKMDMESVTTGDVMSESLVSAGDHEGVWDVIKRMRSHGVRRIPIVNGEGGLEGILALDDIVELLADELNLLAGLVGRERDREAKRRH